MYNEEECLDRCLQSLLNTEQGVPFKILAINDGSTDRSQQILEEYQAQARLQGIAMEILTFTSNQGLVKALDEGINHCDTKFIARIDADDEILDGRLSKQLAFLLQHDGIYAVGCNAIVIESQEKKATTSFITTMPCHPILVAHGMFFNCQVLHPSVMFHTFIVKELGGYSITTSMHRDFSTIEDYALWTSLLQKYPLSIANIPDVGIKLRRRSNSKSHREYVPSVHAKQLLLQQFWTQFIDIQMGSRECEVAGMITSVDSMISDNDATDAIQLLQKMLETFEFKVLTDYDAKGDNKFILQQSLKAQHQKYQRQLTLDIKKRFPTWSSSKDKAKSSDGNVTTLASDSIFDALVSKLIT